MTRGVRAGQCSGFLILLIVFTAIATLLVVVQPAAKITRAAPGTPESEIRPVATLTATIERGSYTWQATPLMTLASTDSAVPFHRGFVVALDKMISLTKPGTAGFKRLRPDAALPVDEGQRFLPLTMVADPSEFLAMELVETRIADDADAPTFDLRRGQYRLELWRFELERNVAGSLGEAIGALKAWGLLYVRAGELLPIAGETPVANEPEVWAAGDATMVERETRVELGSEGEATVLLATVRRADDVTSTTATRTSVTPGASTGGGLGSSTGSNEPATQSAPSEAPADPTAAPTAVSPPPSSSGSGAGSDRGNAGEAAGGVGDLPSIGTSTCSSALDSDSDGLDNCSERVYGTNPNDSDSDDDGLYDNMEVANGFNPASPDSDGDTLDDKQEWLAGTNPLSYDSDGDTITDPTEYTVGTDPKVADSDGDGLHDGLEYYGYGTRPLVEDSDGDCLLDGTEVLTYGTNPLSADTDGDSYWDSTELSFSDGDPLDSEQEPPASGDQFLTFCS